MSDKSIEIVEVGVRDGLQNEEKVLPTRKKLDLIEQLIAAGTQRLEVASFVHPKLVPQMADAEDVVSALPDLEEVTYIGLVLNQRGLERALKTRENSRGVDEVGCVAVASDSFGKKNQGQTSQESIEVSKSLIKQAKENGFSAQVTLSASFGCPFEGMTPVNKTLDIIKSLAEAEPKEIAIADTIGVAVPNHVEEVFGGAKEIMGGIPMRAHFHNTRNTGIASAWAAYRAGATVVDSSIGGLGGCPFAPKATGNVATEDIAFLFEQSGVKTGLKLESLIKTTRWLEDELNKTLPSMLSKAGPFKV